MPFFNTKNIHYQAKIIPSPNSKSLKMKNIKSSTL